MFVEESGVRDLFNLNEIEVDQNQDEEILEVEAHELIAFDLIECEIYEESKKESLINSIKEHGILTPLIVREKDGAYQLLDGHNRLDAGLKAGISKFPVRVLKNITDEEATSIVCTFLLEGQSFEDKKLSLQAEIIFIYYNSIKKQGFRKDLINSVDNDFNDDEIEEENIEFNMSTRQIRKYTRIHEYLTASLKKKMDNQIFALKVAELLSFLNQEEQEQVNLLLESSPQIKIDIKKAEVLKSFSKNGGLTITKIKEILLKEKVKKRKEESKGMSIQIKQEIIEAYFPGMKKQEIEEYVEEAIADYYGSDSL